MKENKFIEKFKHKPKSELEYKIENASLYETDAVEAAKYLLENYSELENIEIAENTQTEFQFKEKAFFKNKWIYRLAVFSSFFIMAISFWASDINESYDLIIWGILNLLFLIVLISKHKKTLLLLKILSGGALCFLVYRYVNFYIILGESDTFTLLIKDMKYLAVYLFIIFGGELIIENRKVKINKKKRYTTPYKNNA
ncbi:hypothetical protein APS56_15985 [Pseudalgibacter alginicilyticus]|uniref:Uncharacterized protein n=1 Tax=Pseudalgibacter alginicilyticus TaxID=1736674 RepID=A0A0P0CJX4_9FLAO|nr:hypothetical protein [Pseudalgibacter alginicilyticus]ALJ06541.1 hypothetical protein APS56_15985 [Pseudalgibacter alginicilyticus]